MTTAPGSVLVLVDHPNLDVVVLPVILEMTRRGHRVRALVCDHGRADRLQAAGVETTANVAVFDAFLGAPDPRLFLNAADLIPQHALGVRCDLLCRAHGVPSLTLQHASYSIGRDIPFPAHLAFAADCIALCGDEDARHYAQLGLDPRRLVVTGTPAFDRLATARAVGGGTAGRGVTIFGQGQTWVGPRSTLGHAPEAWCEELARLYRTLCARFPDAPLRIKPHPAEAAHGIAALYERAVPAELADRVRVPANADDNAQLILDSALVVSFSSSVWLEARFLGRPAVYFSLRPRSGRAGAELEALGGTWLPGRGLDLTARLEPHLERLAQLAREPAPADANVLRRYVGPPDGRAAARVADLAERLLADGPPDVDLPELTFDEPRSRPRLLRPQVSYAHYVHLQALADEVTAAGVEHPKVLELAPEGSDLVAQLPLAFHTRRGGLLTDGPLTGDGPTDAAAVDFDVVVAPDLWSERLPSDPAAELTAMIALARRRVVFSMAAGAVDELHDTAAHLLAGGALNGVPLEDAPPACRPDLEVVDTWCRATGLRVQVRSVHNGASYCQSLLVENLGLEPESLYAVRRSLQTVGYPHERHDGGVRLVFVLEK